MRRLSFAVPLAVVLVALAGATQAQTAAPDLHVEIAYREPADAFEILDNVSGWWPGYTDDAYRAFWADSVGLTPADSVLFERYARLRERYVDQTGQQNADPATSRSGLFTDRAVLSADPIAAAFYRSETMDEAYGRVSQVVQPDEVAFLSAFYVHFADRLAPLTAETRRSTAASLALTQAALDAPEVEAYLQAIRAFFGAEDAVAFTALYVWWPDAERVRASPNGPVLLLRVRPYAGEAISSADVVAHEAVHVVSAMQPDSQKRAVSDAVLATCPGALERTTRLGVLEEPLATALGNIEFRRRFEPRRFSWGRRWYGDPWVDLSARLLYPAAMDALATGGTIAGRFAADAAALCKVAFDATTASSR